MKQYVVKKKRGIHNEIKIRSEGTRGHPESRYRKKGTGGAYSTLPLYAHKPHFHSKQRMSEQSARRPWEQYIHISGPSPTSVQGKVESPDRAKHSFIACFTPPN